MAALALLAAAPAFGQRQVTPPPGIEDPIPPPPPGGLSVSGQGRILISPDLCASLGGASAVPGADYRPGVDVNGDAVAPADLPSGAPHAAGNFPIDVGVFLQKRYGVSANSPLLRGKAAVGVVALRDGRVYFNGEPIGDNERDMLLAACRDAKR